ncbi:DUF3857 domain-containing protein [Flavobacterium sp. MAHUQ-51]|uniref:DUF3857 domain-containing protein n=1 Tax=Flavobacterium sp. GCM10022190 TaxID=3252639 RepID=UPI003623A5A7
MSFKNKFITLLFLLFALQFQAQDFKLGKVSISELQEKVHPKDSSAVAAILYKKGRTYFTYDYRNGFVMNHEFIYRIKIYKKEGLDWGTFEVPYFIGYENMNDDYLSFDEAATYNLENGEIVKTKLNSESSFKTKIDENWKKASISLPNVKEGSVIEFRYKLKSENIVYFPVYEIQYDIPVNYTEYKTEIPSYFYYKTILKGYVEIKNDSKVERGSINYADQNSQSVSVSFQSINSTYTAKDVPALKEEPYVDNLKNYRGAIFNELEKTAFPNSEVKNYSSTWEGVAQTVFKSKDFGPQLKEINHLVEDTKLLLQGVDALDERLKKVFKFVQEKMNWDKEYGYFTEKGVLKAYQERTGNVAEINFILISMLRLAGLKADPVLVSTLEHGIPVFPSRTVFNYVIAAAEVNGERILLDATNKSTSMNILPPNVLNWTGRLIREDGTSEEINLVTKKPSKQNYHINVSIAADGKISGKYLEQKTDYQALKYRLNDADANLENYLEKKENELEGIEISDYVVENKKADLSKPVIEKFNFTSNNHCEIINGKMFIDPLLFFAVTKNPFLQEKRKMPIYFGYPRQERYSMFFEIPEGYEIESLPKSLKMATEDKSLIFSLNSAVNDGRIQIVVSNDINITIATADLYDGLKSFCQKIVEQQQEKIVLKKI